MNTLQSARRAAARHQRMQDMMGTSADDVKRPPLNQLQERTKQCFGLDAPLAFMHDQRVAMSMARVMEFRLGKISAFKTAELIRNAY